MFINLKGDYMGKAKDVCMKILKILVGIILIAVGISSYVWWYPQLILLIKAGLGLVVIFIGLMFVLLGWAD